MTSKTRRRADSSRSGAGKRSVRNERGPVGSKAASQTTIAQVLLALLVVAVYARALGNGFVTLDDEPYVTANSHVRSGITWANLSWAFTATREANWHPLTWISHMLDAELFGMRPWGHHLTSVLIHAATALLVLQLWFLLTARLWASAAVAALFAIHPLRVESVAWVAERKDLLSALFGVLALLAYVRWVRGRQRSAYFAALGFFAASLMSKPMLVTLPFVLLLLDYWPLSRWTAPEGSDPPDRRVASRLLAEKIPFFLLSAASSVVTYWAQKTGGAMADLSVGLLPRLSNAALSYVIYLEKSVAPFSLSVLYPHPGTASAAAIPAAIVLLAISAACVVWARSRPYLAVGWFWYLGTLVPVLGLVQVGWQARADRYTYFPSIGLAVAVVWGLSDLWTRFFAAPRVLRAIAVAAVIFFSVLTWREIGYWKDSETLYEHGLAVTRNNHILHVNLGIERVRQGRLSEAVQHFEEAVRIRSDYWYGQYAYGAALAGNQRPAEGIPHLEAALRLHPGSAEARTALGGALASQGRWAEALAQIRKAVELDPDSARSHYTLGWVLESQGRAEEALPEYRAAVRLEADYAEAHERLGRLLLTRGKSADGLAELAEAVRSQPNSEQLRYTHAVALMSARRSAEAREEVREALRLAPNWQPALTLLTAMLATENDPSESDRSEALRLAGVLVQASGGRDPGALDLMAAAQAQSGRFDEAVETAQRALDLAKASGQAAAAQQIEKRLSFYRAGRPFRAGQ